MEVSFEGGRPDGARISEVKRERLKSIVEFGIDCISVDVPAGSFIGPEYRDLFRVV